MWAHGLTITTTGLEKYDKDAIRQDIEGGGGRYSPNLSKRTTHLVTPEVVGSVTEKLAAAAAGPGQQRFKALQVVSKCWVSASSGLRQRADERQFAPLLPPPGTAVPDASSALGTRSSSGSAQQAAATAAAAAAAAAGNTAAAGPQTPWVVHFSQLPDESVYGALQQHTESPSAVRQLAQQLHLQLSPISEAPSQEQATPGQRTGQSYGPLSSAAAAAYAEQEGPVLQTAACASSSLSSGGVAPGSWALGLHGERSTTPPKGPWQKLAATLAPQHLHEQQQPQQLGHLAAQAPNSHTSSSHAAPAGGLPAWEPAHHHDHDAGESTRARMRPPALQVPAGRRCSSSSSGGGRGNASCTIQQQQPQQQQAWPAPRPPQQHPAHHQHHHQQQLGLLQQDAAWTSTVHGGSGSMLGCAVPGSAAAVAAAAAGVQAHWQQQQQPVQETWQHLQQQQQQQQQRHLQHYSDGWMPPAAGASSGSTCGAPSGGRGSSSSVGELVAALQRATCDSRRGTSESAPSPAAAGQSGTPSKRTLSGFGHGGVQLSSADAVAAPSTSAAAAGSAAALHPPSCHSGHVPLGIGSSGSGSIEVLLQSLKRLSDRTAAAAAGEEEAGPVHPVAAAAPSGPHPLAGEPGMAQPRSAPAQHAGQLQGQLQQQQQHHQQHQQQQEEALGFWGSVGGAPHTPPHRSAAGTSAGGAATSSHAQRSPSPLNLGQLLGNLHTASGSSRRSTAEAAVAVKAAGQVTPGAGSWPNGPGVGPAGGSGDLRDLLGALQHATGDSRRGTAEAAATYGPLPTSSSNHGSSSPRGGGAVEAVAGPGSVVGGNKARDVEELMDMLRRATGDSRRGTADAAGTAPGPLYTDKPPHASSRNGISSSGGSNRAGSLEELMGLLHRATDESRRATAEPAGPAAAAGPVGSQGGMTELLGLLPSAAAAPTGPAISGSGIGELLGLLRRATGDNRREAGENGVTSTPGSMPDGRTAAASGRRGIAEAAAGGTMGAADAIAVAEVPEHAAGRAVHSAAGTSGAAGSSSGAAGSGGVEQLLGLLQRATTDSRRGTEELASGSNGGSSSSRGLAEAAAAAAAADGFHEAAVNTSGLSLSQLLGQLRRATGDTQPAGGMESSSSATPAAAVGAVYAGQAGAVCLPELLGQLHRATGDSRRGTAEQAGTAGCHESSADSRETPGRQTGGSGDLAQLLAQLHRTTGDRRRGTADTAAAPSGALNSISSSGVAAAGPGITQQQAGAQDVAAAAVVALPLSQGQGGVAEPAARHSRGAAGAAGPRVAGQLVWGSGAGVAAGAAEDGFLGAQYVNVQEQQQQQQQQQQHHLTMQLPQQHGSSGGSSSVTELIAALRRATGESRRNTVESFHNAAAADGADGAEFHTAPAGDASIHPDALADRRDRPLAAPGSQYKQHKPHLSLMLPRDYGSRDDDPVTLHSPHSPHSAEPTTAQAALQQGQQTQHADAVSVPGPAAASAAITGAPDNTSSGLAGEEGVHEAGGSGIGGLISALQCIAAASKLQEAAAWAPEVTAAAQCQVAALESEVEAMPGSEYAQLVSRLSLELSELNKQELTSLQQQQEEDAHEEGGERQQQLQLQQGLGSLPGLLRSLGAPAGADAGLHSADPLHLAAAMGAVKGTHAAAATGGTNLEAAFASVSAGSQGLQQLLDALRRVGAERQDAGALVGSSAGTVMQQQQQQPPAVAPVMVSGAAERQVAADQPLQQQHQQPHQPGPHADAQQLQKLQALLHPQVPNGYVQQQHQQQQQQLQLHGRGEESSAVPEAVGSNASSLERLLAALHCTRGRSPAASPAAAAGVGVTAPGPSSSCEHVEVNTVMGQHGHQQQPDDLQQQLGMVGMDVRAGSSIGGAADLQQHEQQCQDVAEQQHSQVSIADSDAGEGAHQSQSSMGAAAAAVAWSPQPAATPRSAAALAAQQKQSQQQQQQWDGAGGAVAAAAVADAAAVPLPLSQTPPPAHDSPTPTHASPADKEASEPAYGARSNSSSSNGSTKGMAAASRCGDSSQVVHIPSLAVVFDRQVPTPIKQQLSQVLTACGATVVPGAPHLGCGANLIVCQPEAAASLLPLLLDVVTPAWLGKACKWYLQQQQQQQEGAALLESVSGGGAGLTPNQRLVRLSPDAARAVGLHMQQTGTSLAAPADNGDSMQQQRSPTATTAAAAGLHPSSAAARGEGVARVAGRGLQHWGSTLSNGGGSSFKEQQVPALVVPKGYAATSAGCNMPVLLQELQTDGRQQQQQVMMPAALLTDQLWSVGQHPRMVAAEELEAVVLPGCLGTTLTLLLPHSSCSLLGHAAVSCTPSDPSKGVTCGDVLAAVHGFYQQDVMLLEQGCCPNDRAAASPAASAGSPGLRGVQDSQSVHCRGSQGPEGQQGNVVTAGALGHGLNQQQQQGEDGEGGVLTGSQGGVQGGVVIKRLQLLGHKQMFEGLFRATKDPHSTMYEVCLA